MTDVSGKFFSAKKVRTGVSPSSPGVEVGETLPPVNPPGAGLNSVGLTMPSAFAVANSPLTSNGTLEVTGAGTVAQYVRGDGSLADFPESSGGGSSVSYYLNGSVSQGTIGGVAYLEMNKVPILGAGTDFTRNSNGYIASFITDAGDPNLLEIPGGNWNFESYFSASSGGGSPTFYVELYKVNAGGTATLIASNSANPELISFGTTIAPYFSSLAVPTTTLALTDRLALRYYVNTSGRTITLHTENDHLCQVITTFTTGLTALNGLTTQVQFFAVGTSGTDFNIASATDTHTFNLPTASATNRGALSSADWSLFTQAYNDKINSASVTGTTTKTLTLTQQDGGTITASWTDLNTDAVISVFGRTGAVVAANGDYTTAQVTESGNLYFTNARSRQAISLTTSGTSGAATYDNSTGVFNIPQYQSVITNPVTGTGSAGQVAYWSSSSAITGESNLFWDASNDRLGIGTATPATQLNVGHQNHGIGLAYLGASSFPPIAGIFTSEGTAGGQTGYGSLLIKARTDFAPFYSINFYTAATANVVEERMRITAAGRVLIGTPIPSESTFALDVNGTGRFSDSLTINGNIQLTTGANRLLRIGSSTAYYYDLQTVGDDFQIREAGTTPRLTFSYPTGNAIFSSSITATSIIRSGGTSSQYLMADGSVSTLSNPVTGTGASGQVAYWSSGSAITGESNLIWDATNDRLGISVSIPSASLHVSDASSASRIIIDNSSNAVAGSGIWMRTLSGGSIVSNATLRTDNAGNFSIFNGTSTDTENLRIFSNGNVLIQSGGTFSNAGFKLDVNGTGRFSGNLSTGSGASFTNWSTTGNVDLNDVYLSMSSSGTFGGAISNNAYFNSGWKYKAANNATLYQTTAGEHRFFTAGVGAAAGNAISFTQALTITSGGNVGIGESTIGARLHVADASGATRIIVDNTANAAAGSGIYMRTLSGGSMVSNATLRTDNAGNFAIFTGTSSDTTRMTIASGGSVTINNLSGSGNRIVVANSGGTLISAVIGSGLAFDGTTLTATGGGSGSISGSGTSGTVALFTGATSIGNSVITQSSGNVLIGTGTPAARLTVVGATTLIGQTNVSARFSDDNNSTLLISHPSGTSNTATITGNINLGFATGASGSITEKVRILSNGNVGIGTTSFPSFSASQQLTMKGGSSNTNSILQVQSFDAGTSLTIYSGASSSDDPAIIFQKNLRFSSTTDTALGGYNERMRITSGGNVLIGTETNNGNKLRVNGTIFSDSSVTATSFFESSDATLKTLVQDDYQAKGIESVVAKLYIKNGKQELGYFAQDLQGILPSAVNKGSDGLLNLSYREVHTAKIAYLEEEIRQIKKRYEIN